MSELRAVEIRILDRKDLDAVLDIDAQHSGQRRDELLKRRLERAFEPGRLSTSLVAEQQGQVIGVILGEVLVGEFGATDPSAIIDTLGVRQGLEGMGVARRLLQAFVNNVRALGVERVQTHVAISNAQLLSFFSKAGFLHAQAVPLQLDLASLRAHQWERHEEEELEQP